MSCPRCRGGLLRGECIACGWSVEAEQDRQFARTSEYSKYEPRHDGPKNGVVSIGRPFNTGCDVCKNPITSGEHMVRCEAVWSRLRGRWV